MPAPYWTPKADRLAATLDAEIEPPRCSKIAARSIKNAELHAKLGNAEAAANAFGAAWRAASKRDQVAIAAAADRLGIVMTAVTR